MDWPTFALRFGEMVLIGTGFILLGAVPAFVIGFEEGRREERAKRGGPA